MGGQAGLKDHRRVPHTGFSCEIRREEGSVAFRWAEKGRRGKFPADYNFVYKAEEERVALSWVRRQAGLGSADWTHRRGSELRLQLGQM